MNLRWIDRGFAMKATPICRLGVLLAASLAAGAAAQPSDLDEQRRLQRNAEFDYEKSGDLVVIEADPGVETVKPFRPTWCDAVKPLESPQKSRTAGWIRRTLGTTQQYGFSDEKTAGYMRQFCAFPDDPGFQKQLGFVVQLWVNYVGQTSDEAVKSMVARIDHEGWEKAKQADCDKLKVDDEASEEQKRLAWARRTLFGCTPNQREPYYRTREGGPDIEWYVDRRAQPKSRLEQLYFALDCLPKVGKPLDKHDWVLIGICGPDIRMLDSAAVAKETAKMGEPFQRMAQEGVAHAKMTLAHLERMAKDKIESDPDYAKVIVDAPKAAWTAWEKDYKKYKEAVEATYEFEQQLGSPRKSAAKECWALVEPGLLKFVKSKKIKNAQQFKEAIQEGVGYGLFNALGACYAVSQPTWVGYYLLEVTKNEPISRGPRAAARQAIANALSEVKSDRERFPITFGSFGRWDYKNEVRAEADRRRESSTISLLAEGSGVVKAVKDVGKQKVVATFKSESWMETQFNCVETNRIQKIEKGGRIVYRRKCTPSGKAKRTHTASPMVVYKWAAKGLKPNGFIRAAVPAGSNHMKAERRAYPIEIYKTKQQKQLLNMYGFPL